MSTPPDTTRQGSGLQPVAELPESLAGLPRLGFARRPAANRAESARTDIVFNVQSLDDLVQAARQHFGIGKPPTTTP